MKSSKPIITIIIVIFLSIIIVGSYILFMRHKIEYQTKTITNFFENNPNKINKIDVINGNNGEITSITNKAIINDVSDYLSKLSFKKFSPPESSGWSYRFSIYENSKNVFNITFNGDEFCKINSSKYKIEKSDKKIESLYKKIKSFNK